MEKYGFVYLWFDRKHKRYYVGCHWGHENDSYICSSSWMKKAYKIRPNDFKRRILKTNIINRHTMFIEEQRYLDMIKLEEIKVRYYNLNIKNNEVWHKYDDNVKTISKKISIKTKEAMQNPEIRERYLESLKTRDTKSSDLEVRAKRSAAMMGKNKGNWANAAKASADKRRGVPISDDLRNKIKEAGVFREMNSRVIVCIHCGTEGNPGVIGRYHNKNCKRICI